MKAMLKQISWHTVGRDKDMKKKLPPPNILTYF